MGPSARPPSYRGINGVSLAYGDPLGDGGPGPARCSGRTRARHADAAVLAAADRGHATGRSGLDLVELGDEAIGEVAHPSRPPHAAVRRQWPAATVGYTCEVARQQDLPTATVAEAVRAAAEFRHGGVERGFSMALSRLGDSRDDDCVLVLCRDDGLRVRGVLQFVPWGTDGLSLDVMRGDRSAENGLTEFMVVAAIEAASRLGVHRVSRTRVLRRVRRADELGAGPVLRIGPCDDGGSRSADRGADRANAKYHPTCNERYMCFPNVGKCRASPWRRARRGILQSGTAASDPASQNHPRGRLPRRGEPPVVPVRVTTDAPISQSDRPGTYLDG